MGMACRARERRPWHELAMARRDAAGAQKASSAESMEPPLAEEWSDLLDSEQSIEHTARSAARTLSGVLTHACSRAMPWRFLHEGCGPQLHTRRHGKNILADNSGLPGEPMEPPTKQMLPTQIRSDRHARYARGTSFRNPDGSPRHAARASSRRTRGSSPLGRRTPGPEGRRNGTLTL